MCTKIDDINWRRSPLNSVICSQLCSLTIVSLKKLFNVFFFIVSSDLDLEFNHYFAFEEASWWPYVVNVNVNNTPMTIEGGVCKTFCLWTCILDVVCFEKWVFVY